MEIAFEVPIAPRGQARARHSVIHGAGGRVFSHTYKSGAQRREEEKLAAMVAPHRPPQPFSGAISIEVTAFLPVPQMSRKKTALALSGGIRHTKKPDLDNIVKHLLDVLRGMMYRDDKQIVSICANKRYGDPPRWCVRIRDVDE